MTSTPSRSTWIGVGSWPLLIYIGLVPGCIAASFRLSGHDASRILQLGLLASTGLLLTLLPWQPPNAPRVRTVLWLVAVAALAVASVANAAVPLMALRELALYLGLTGLVLASVPSIAADNGRRWVRLAILTGSGIQAFLLVFVAAAAVLTHRSLVWSELAGGYDNYRFFNHVQTVALPLLAGVVVTERRGSPAWVTAWFSLTVYAAYVCCSGARGTAIAVTAASALSLMVFGRSRAWPLARTLLLAFAFGATLYAFAFLVLPAWSGYRLGAAAERSMASLSSDSSRLQLWSLALEQIAGSPWVGIGPMHYAHIPNPKAAHPHNVYLQVAAEWGVPMLLMVLVGVWRGLTRFGRTVRATADGPVAREGAMLWVAAVAILLDATVSGNFVMPVSQVWIALCAAWAIAWLRQQRDPVIPDPAVPAPVWRLIGVSVLASQVWLTIAVWPEAADLEAHLVHVRRDIVHNAKMNPRFWSNGWF